jgi:hypothetical protein
MLTFGPSRHEAIYGTMDSPINHYAQLVCILPHYAAVLAMIVRVFVVLDDVDVLDVFGIPDVDDEVNVPDVLEVIEVEKVLPLVVVLVQGNLVVVQGGVTG